MIDHKRVYEALQGQSSVWSVFQHYSEGTKVDMGFWSGFVTDIALHLTSDGCDWLSFRLVEPQVVEHGEDSWRNQSSVLSVVGLSQDSIKEAIRFLPGVRVLRVGDNEVRVVAGASLLEQARIQDKLALKRAKAKLSESELRLIQREARETGGDGAGN